MEKKTKVKLISLSILSLFVGVFAVLTGAWWIGLLAILFAFLLYRQQINEDGGKKYFIIAIIACFLGCIGIVRDVIRTIEDNNEMKMKAQNEAFRKDMESFVSELSPIAIDPENVKIDKNLSNFFKVKSVSIEPKEIQKANYDKSEYTEELDANDFEQRWTAKILFERIGKKISSKSDIYYYASLNYSFEDESGNTVVNNFTEETGLGRDDFYESIGKKCESECSFILGKGKEKDAVSKIKFLTIESNIETGSKYQDRIEEQARRYQDMIENQAKEYQDMIEKEAEKYTW